MTNTDMTLPTEKEIIRDMYRFLRDHDDPPGIGTEACTEFWMRAAQDIGQLVSGQWNNHPLAMVLGMAVYDYLEKKCKAKARSEKARK